MTKTGLHNLFSKRVVFVTGKGGVGKTTVTAALGVAASNAGKKTLVVELDTEGNIPKFFEENAAFNKPKKLGENLFAITIQPKNALHEYIILKLRFETIYKILFENRVVKFFINAVPGLNEILMIGKIWHLYSQTKNKGEPLYDLIIVDAPATGHSISFLQVPQTVRNIVRLGPIHEDAKKIETLINDREKTAVCLVTLPEEMPTNEAIDFFLINKSTLNFNIEMVLVNKFVPKLFSEDELYKLQTVSAPQYQNLISDIKECAQFLYRRHSLNQKNLERLEEEINRSTNILPFLFTEDLERKHIAELANILMEGNSP